MENNTMKIGISFVDCLQLLFIAFKLLKIINGSGWGILAPTWISVLLVLIIYIICGIVIMWR